MPASARVKKKSLTIVELFENAPDGSRRDSTAATETTTGEIGNSDVEWMDDGSSTRDSICLEFDEDDDDWVPQRRRSSLQLLRRQSKSRRASEQINDVAGRDRKISQQSDREIAADKAVKSVEFADDQDQVIHHDQHETDHYDQTDHQSHHHGLISSLLKPIK